MDELDVGPASIFLATDPTGRCRLYTGQDEPLVEGSANEIADWLEDAARQIRQGKVRTVDDFSTLRRQHAYLVDQVWQRIQTDLTATLADKSLTLWPEHGWTIWIGTARYFGSDPVDFHVKEVEFVQDERKLLLRGEIGNLAVLYGYPR